MKFMMPTVVALSLVACAQNEPEAIVEYDVPYTGGKLGETAPPPKPPVTGMDRDIDCEEQRRTVPLASLKVYCYEDETDTTPEPEVPVVPETPVEEPEEPVAPPPPPPPPMPPMPPMGPPMMGGGD